MTTEVQCDGRSLGIVKNDRRSFYHGDWKLVCRDQTGMFGGGETNVTYGVEATDDGEGGFFSRVEINRKDVPTPIGPFVVTRI